MTDKVQKAINKYENKFNCPRCNHSLEKARKDIPNLKYCPNGCGASFIKK